MISPKDDCSLCGLCKGRANIVRPSGDLGSKVVLVGEGPGENEDIQGKPFVGRAGKILDKALAEAGVDRDRVMITNTVKCRPPQNRDPTAEEMEACRPFLMSELEGREMVVLLGRSAIKDLLGYDGPMNAIVNTIQEKDVDGIRIRFLPTYHPMACVYRKEARQKLADAMSMVREIIS